MKMHSTPLRAAPGFTLIELMIVLVIMAVLTAIAIPSFTRYFQDAHRANAAAALLRTAQWLERAATAQGAYPTDLTSAAAVAASTVDGDRYAVSFTTAPAATTTSFTLQAVPRATGANASDKCGTLTLTSTGVKGVTSLPSGSTATVANCW